MTMPGMDGMALLDHIKNTSPATECIMLTTINESRNAVACLRKGAYDYLVKPVAKAVLTISLPKALERKRLLDIFDMEKRQTHDELDNPDPFKPIITQAPVMQRVLKEAELHAAGNVPILISGESGTGKELLAWAMHAASPRSAFPFTPINMASIVADSSDLFETELFSQTHDELSDNVDRRQGFLEHTHQGTLYLEEIGDLPMDLQGKMLQILQEGVFSRLGSSKRVPINLRFIAATSEDLHGMMARNVFRKDLYSRFRAGWLHLPPLRERSGDIALLANAFLEKYPPYFQTTHRITPGALTVLSAYHWPGNVRELKSVVQSAVNSAKGKPIEERHLPQHLRSISVSGTETAGSAEDRLVLPLAKMEKEHILRAYAKLHHNKAQTARALGIGLNTLRRKLRDYGRT
jgi:DNA-binding NtrC family response regulator